MKQLLRLGEYYALAITCLSLVAVLTIMCLEARAQRPDLSGPVLSGVVIDTAGNAISGATIVVKGRPTKTITNDQGEFMIRAPNPSGTLEITYLGYQTIHEKFNEKSAKRFRFRLSPVENVLEEVEISTGYQTIPRERATGSFVQIDNELLERRVAATIIEKLDGVAPGLQFDNRTGTSKLNIRGINTLNSGLMDPLIVVDNFPYEGGLANINPNDVASVSILKDAAATSIWGARAGNGVIVINLKKPKEGIPFRLSLTANTSITEKPDLFYNQVMNSSDFIDVEKMLFERGYYTATLNGPNAHKLVFSPVITLLDKQSNGLISESDVTQQINALRNHDYRNDLMKYVYRSSLNQQYQLRMDGSAKYLNHFLSVGYDDNTQSMKGFSDNRLTIRSVNVFKPTSKLNIETRLTFSNAVTQAGEPIPYPINPGGGKSNLYPYARLIDDEGTLLKIPKNYNLNYTDTAGHGLLLDWSYRPLAEMDRTHNHNNTQHFGAGLILNYEIFKGLKAELQYSHEREVNNHSNLAGHDAFSTRELINLYTQVNDDAVKHIIPLGAILRKDNSTMQSHRARAQLSFQQTFSQRHEVAAFGGAEVSHRSTDTYGFQTYGYDENILTNVNVDYINRYPIYDGLKSASTIQSYGGFGGSVRRFVSFFGNAAYTYNHKYIVSFSARKDAANLFGVKTNDKWNPIWSSGWAWIASNEGFLQDATWLNLLKLRATYGHSGNAGGGSAKPIILYSSNAPYTNLPYANISTPPNPYLKWEDVRMINYGLDFSVFDAILSGSLEYFTKKASDLITSDPIDPTTGFNVANRNVAEIRSKGFDLQLNSRNTNGQVKWGSSVSLSHVRDIVTKFNGTVSATSRYVASSGKNFTPLRDKVLYPVFSYKFVGLDPENGAPIGMLNGEPSTDYTKILTDSLQHLNYHGSGLPLFYGFLRNNFSYKRFDLSFNITFKFGYFFQRETINYGSLFNGWMSHADFEKRWQKPGDEKTTTVPAMNYPNNNNSDAFYGRSEAVIEKGDHIRLQDIRLSYAFAPTIGKRTKRITWQCYLTTGNVALLWTATKSGLDPDYTFLPPARIYSFGLKGTF